MPKENFLACDVLILGAGAAGLFCAIEAAKRGRHVIVLDHATRLCEKIRISGGGRCNFTNIHASPAQYISMNPHFAVSALSRYTPADFLALLRKHRIAYHEKILGQMFCNDSSQQIIDMLLAECRMRQVVITPGVHVVSIKKNEGEFIVETQEGTTYKAVSFVVATGGKSIPKIGATGFGYHVASQFGLPVVPTRAALVPFTLQGNDLTLARSLAGVSVEAVNVSCNNVGFDEAMLFTHRGLSGPSMLQISSYWTSSKQIVVNFIPQHDLLARLKEEKQHSPKHEVITVLARYLPRRLAMMLVEKAKAYGKLADLSFKRLEETAKLAHHFEITPEGTEGYRTAEVTLGGVDTNSLSSKTMEARDVPGLYFIGEVVDVTGHLGGYNFQWAWSSAYAAGQVV